MNNPYGSLGESGDFDAVIASGQYVLNINGVRMNKLYFLAVIGMVVVVAGCQTQPISIDGSQSTFHQLDREQYKGKTLALQPVPADRAQTLEWESYKKRFAKAFASQGFVIEPDVAKAAYIAFISYGIDDGKNVIVSVPIVGQTGSVNMGGSASVKVVGSTAYVSSRSYSMPTYGVVGAASSTQTVYKRVLQIDIVDGKSLELSSPRKVYEAKLTSKGSCSTFASVFDYLTDMIFDAEWPGRDGAGAGKTRMVRPEFSC